MRSELTIFDPMDHLDTIEDQAELLNDALATGDASVIGNVIGMIAAKRGVTNLPRDTGLTGSSLDEAVGADANLTLGTLLTVLDGLGLGLRATARDANAAHA